MTAVLLFAVMCMPVEDATEDGEAGASGSPAATGGSMSDEGGSPSVSEGGSDIQGGTAGAPASGGEAGMPDGGEPNAGGDGGASGEAGSSGSGEAGDSSGGEPGTVGSWPGGFLQYDLGLPLHIAVDPEGNTFILDQTSNEIRMFDATGLLVWSREPEHVEAFRDRTPRMEEIDVDDEGNVYFVGTTTGVFPGEPGRNTNDLRTDWFVGKFGPDGETVWIHQFGIPTIGTATAEDLDGRSIAVSASGAVYIAGFNSGINPRAIPDQINRDHDAIGADPYYRGGIYIAKYDTDGEKYWVAEYGDEEEYGEDFGLAFLYTWGSLASDDAGNVYLVGLGMSADPSEGNDPYVLKLNPDGTREWLTRIRTGDAYEVPSDTGLKGISVSADGETVYIGGTSQADYATEGFPNIKDPSGLSDGTPYTGFVAKLDGDGSFLWGRNLYALRDPSTCVNPNFCYERLTAHDMVAESDGSATYLVGNLDGYFPGEVHGGGTYDAFVAAYDSEGSLLWARQISGDAQTGSDDTVYATAWDPVGLLAIAGSTNGLLGEMREGTGYNIFLAKLHPEDGSD